MANDKCLISVKVFLEELDMTGNNAYTTGKLTELKGWSNVTYNQAASLSKSMNITIPNSLDLLTTSIQHTDKTKVSADTEAAKRYIDDIYSKYESQITYTNPFRANKGLTDRYSEFLDKSFHYGVLDQKALDITSIETSGFAVTLMQRVWVLFRTDGLSNTPEDVKYSVVAGIITGVGDEYDVEGTAYNLQLSISGLHRLLELSQIHISAPVYNLKDDLTKEIAEHIMKPILQGFAAYENAFANLSPCGGYVFALWLTNMMFSFQGSKSDYNNVHTDRNHGYFYHEPLWILPKMPLKQGKIINGYASTVYKHWVIAVKDALDRPEENVLVDSNMDKIRNSFVPEALYTGETDVEVFDLIPIPVFDPLITLLFEKTGVVQKKIRGAFELFAINTMTAADIITKIATAATAVCYESDSGQIVIEIPKTWRAPHNDKRVDLIKEYETFYTETTKLEGEEEFLGVLDIRGKESYTEDYIIHGGFLKNRSSDHNESNIVTDVEATANMNFVSAGEKLLDLSSTGRTSIDAPYQNILQLQRRFGIRSEQLEPILTNGFSFQTDDSGEAANLSDMLDKYAESTMIYRNFAQKACTFATVFLHWLSVNNNILYAERGELWMMTDKSLSYSSSGEYSCSFSTAWGHSLGERLGNPFIDAYVYAENHGELLEVINSTPKTEVEEIPATTETEYEALATKWANHYGLEPAFVKSIIQAESGWVHSKPSKGGAIGLMQLIKTSGWAQGIKDGQLSSSDDINDPNMNVKAGCYYLSWLKRYFAKPKLVVAGYNGGPGVVRSAINKEIGSQFSGSSRMSHVRETCKRFTQIQIDSIIDNLVSTDSVISPQETSLYVAKVGRIYQTEASGKQITEAFNV